LAELLLLEHVARAAELADELGAPLAGEHVEQLGAAHGERGADGTLAAAPAAESSRALFENPRRKAGEQVHQHLGRTEPLADEVARRRRARDVRLEPIDSALVGAGHRLQEIGTSRRLLARGPDVVAPADRRRYLSRTRVVARQVTA